MTKTTAYNIRVHVKTSQRIQELAETTGLPANDVINQALQEKWGIEVPPDPTIELLLSLSSWIADNFSPNKFPDDIILIGTRHIRDDPQLRALYEEAIRGKDGKPDPKLKKLLAQKIGRCIKRSLHAQTFARSLMLPSTDDLITSYSLLRPSPPEETDSKAAPKKGRKKPSAE